MKKLSLDDIRTKMMKAKPFSPYAEFDSGMDCIRVYLRDCSSTEDRVSPHITLIYDNHAKPNQTRLSGFVIKGIHQLGMPLVGVQLVSDVINSIVKLLPAEEASEMIAQGVTNNPEVGEMQVLIPELEAA